MVKKRNQAFSLLIGRGLVFPRNYGHSSVSSGSTLVLSSGKHASLVKSLQFYGIVPKKFHFNENKTIDVRMCMCDFASDIAFKRDGMLCTQRLVRGFLLVVVIRINPFSDAFLLFDPFVNVFFVTVKEQEFPAFEELGKEEQSSGNEKQHKERENDSDRLGVLNDEDEAKEQNLEKSKSVDTAFVDILGVRSGRILAWLLEEEEEAIPKLNSRHGRKTHEEEHPKQDGEGNLLDGG